MGEAERVGVFRDEEDGFVDDREREVDEVDVFRGVEEEDDAGDVAGGAGGGRAGVGVSGGIGWLDEADVEGDGDVVAGAVEEAERFAEVGVGGGGEGRG